MERASLDGQVQRLDLRVDLRRTGSAQELLAHLLGRLLCQSVLFVRKITVVVRSIKRVVSLIRIYSKSMLLSSFILIALAFCDKLLVLSDGLQVVLSIFVSQSFSHHIYLIVFLLSLVLLRLMQVLRSIPLQSSLLTDCISLLLLIHHRLLPSCFR